MRFFWGVGVGANERLALNEWFGGPNVRLL